MKVRHFAIGLVLLAAPQQKPGVMDSLRTKGRAQVLQKMQTELMPRLQAYFPGAYMMPAEDTKIITINTGVTGVNRQFLEKLGSSLAEELQQLQQEKNGFMGIAAVALGVFPEELRFEFNKPQCGDGSDTPMDLNYQTQNALVTIAIESQPAGCLTGSHQFEIELAECLTRPACKSFVESRLGSAATREPERDEFPAPPLYTP